jgi:hypothetical protein
LAGKPEQKDLIIALRDCLDPEVERAPTQQQKLMVLQWITHESFLMRPIYSGSEDLAGMAFKEGRRSVGLQLLAMLEKDPFIDRQKKANK